MNTTRALVTGGVGFIGSHLARRLVGGGQFVGVVDNLATGHRRNLEDVMDRIEFREGDLCDVDVCTAAVDSMKVVYHVAALPSVPRSMADPIGTRNANVNATLNLLEAGRRASVRRFVYSSSSSANGDTPMMPKVETAELLPRSPFAAAKLAGGTPSPRRKTVRHAHERAGDVRDSQASLDRGGAVLGYAPRVTVRAGIERLSSRGISRIPAA